MNVKVKVEGNCSTYFTLSYLCAMVVVCVCAFAAGLSQICRRLFSDRGFAAGPTERPVTRRRRTFFEKLSQKNLKSGNGKSLTTRLWNLRQSGDRIEFVCAPFLSLYLWQLLFNSNSNSNGNGNGNGNGTGNTRLNVKVKVCDEDTKRLWNLWVYLN
jgi:hypothetical protein